MRLNHLCTLFIFCPLFLFSQAVDRPAFKNRSPQSLLDESIESPSVSEKVAIRSYLSKRHSSTPEGLFSKAYIASHNGQDSLSAALYEKCLEKYPDFQPALSNHFFTMKSDLKDYSKAETSGEKLLSLNPSFINYIRIKDMYFMYVNDLKDQARADRFLEKWQEQVGNSVYIFDYIRGAYAEYNENDYKKAEKFYEKALDKKGAEYAFDVYRQLINLRKDKIYEGDSPNTNKNRGDKLSHFTILTDKVKEIQNNSNPSFQQKIFVYQSLEFIGDYLSEQRSYNDALNYYNQAFKYYYPTSDIVSKIEKTLRHNQSFTAIVPTLNAALTTLPNNSEILSLLARHYEDKDTKKADEYYQKAISSAITLGDTMSRTFGYCYFLENIMLDYEKSYQQLLPLYPYAKYNTSIYTFLVNNRYHAKAYSSAKKYLTEDEAYLTPKGNVNTEYFESFRYILNEALAVTARTETINTVSQDTRIEATTVLTIDYTEFSPDGKYFVSGYNPMQLWDAEKMIKLRNFDNNIGYRKFSPDGKYIAGILWLSKNETNTYLLIVYETATGNVVSLSHIPSTSESIGSFMCWSPDNKQLAIFNSNGFILVFDVTQKKFIQTIPILNFISAGPILWTPDNKYIICCQKYDGGDVQIFNAQTFEREKILSEVDWPHALGCSYNGRYLLASDNHRTLHVWDSEYNWQHTSYRNTVFPGKIVSHPSKYQVVMNDWGGGEHNKGVLYDFIKGESLAEIDAGDKNYDYFFAHEGQTIIRPSFKNNNFEVYDTRFQLKNKLEGESSKPLYCFKDEKNKQLLTHDTEGVHIWDVKNGKKVHSWKINLDYLMRVEGKEDEFIGYVTSKEKKRTEIYKYNISDYSQTLVMTLESKIHLLKIKNGKYIICHTKFMDANTGSDMGSVSVYDLSDFNLINSFDIKLSTRPLVYDRLGGSGFVSMAVNADVSKLIVATYWVDGWGMGASYTKIARIYNLNTGKIIRNISISEDIGNVDFITNEKVGVNKLVYNITTGNYIEKEKNVGDTLGRKLPVYLNFDNNLNVEYTATNELNFSNRKSGAKVLTIAIKKQNEWIAYTPKGDFTSSLNGVNKCFWIRGAERLPFDALKDKYEKPDVISNSLLAVSNNTTNNTVNSATNNTVIATNNTANTVTAKDVPAAKVDAPIENDIFKPPYQIQLVSATDIKTVEEKYVFTLSFTKANEQLANPEILYTVNGREFQKRGITPVTQNQINQEIPLQEGLNVIQAYLSYKGVRLMPQTAIIFKETAKSKKTIATNLWFFGVGITEYQIATQNLQYAHQDVLDLERSLKKQEGKLYSKVNSMVLVNQNATERNITIKMNEFISQASDKDIIFIYIAGHGIQDNTQNLYFITHDGDLAKPYTGMAINKFTTLLEGLPVTQKAVFMLDICQAGGMNMTKRGNITPEEIIKKLAEGTGTIVLAASSGKESSVESNVFGGGHGAFTFALLTGLSGEADKTNGDSNGVVSILELQQYISSKVPELTKGIQHPTTTMVNNLTDFPICSY
jgi:WD40 repeat protein